MYVGPWQEYRALARARHAEALYATRGPETQVADELERLRRALELVSGELPADKAAKVREALAPVAEPGRVRQVADKLCRRMAGRDASAEQAAQQAT